MKPVAVESIPSLRSALATFTPFPPATVADLSTRRVLPASKPGTQRVLSTAGLSVTVTAMFFVDK
jgi:hypothetical protein